MVLRLKYFYLLNTCDMSIQGEHDTCLMLQHYNVVSKNVKYPDVNYNNQNIKTRMKIKITIKSTFADVQINL